jgi:hypothetical protein
VPRGKELTNWLSTDFREIHRKIEMAIKPPITDLPIDTDSSGFYEGFNKIVALGSKILIGLLILWAAV